MKKQSLFVILLLVCQATFSQNNNPNDFSVIKQHFKELTKESKNASLDYSEWKITSTAPSLKKGLTHYYLTQYYKGIPIVNGTYNMSVVNGKVNYSKNQFITDLASQTSRIRSNASITEEQAVSAVTKSHNLSSARLVRTTASMRGEAIVSYKNSGITENNEPILVKKVYFFHEGELRLCWNVNLYEKGGSNWWNSFVDASSSKILFEDNWVITCNFGESADHKAHKHPVTNTTEFFSNSIGQKTERLTEKAPLAANSYNVYPVPLVDPEDGSRAIITNPADVQASPYGWHDTNGSAGAEYTITRGNNVWAQEDANGNNGTGVSPDGGRNLEFNYPVDLNGAPSNYTSASTTNLFYWNNIMHDVWYHYGFDEASGNFQENNYGKGGTGGDAVYADAQDGRGTNNANFATPPDGRKPRMQMYLWTRTQPGRDGSFDNNIIAHEYGHGISIRLVGGRNRNVLGGSEQMGEGWSDWFGLMLTMKAGDKGTDKRGVGTYVLGQGRTGNGIRPTPYSTDRGINNTDYADIGSLRVPHGVGYAFATILWDMTWLLIEKEGFDPDLYKGKGGNNVAMALVIEGLKNTASNPGFVSGRDGILQADRDLYGGKYKCLIWKAFAGRGVGKDAVEDNNGGFNSNNDQTVSFVDPCGGGGDPDPTPDNCKGDVASFPFKESFETGLGKWEDAKQGDELNFTRKTGGTPSIGTGPSGAAEGSYYVYVEASGSGHPSKRAILKSPCLNFSSLTTPSLSFKYHMYGTNVATLTVEVRQDNKGTWSKVFEKKGDQGNQWIDAKVDLKAYAKQASVQIRFNVVTGAGTNGWRSDIAIDAISVNKGGGGTPPGGDCKVINFNQQTISSFATQDRKGDYAIGDAGKSLTLENNTWKFIPMKYNVTQNTVIEFEFSSTSEGEIHGIGFEDDNYLTANRYFKVYGTQNFGITNYDDYTGGTKKYKIAVGSSYTGTMDRLVFINDKDAGGAMGNNSTFKNVKIYEGSCGQSSNVVLVESLGDRIDVIGDEDEDAFANVSLAPNPIIRGDKLRLRATEETLKDTSYKVINTLGQVLQKGILKGKTIPVGKLKSGVYILSLENNYTQSNKRFVVE